MTEISSMKCLPGNGETGGTSMLVHVSGVSVEDFMRHYEGSHSMSPHRRTEVCATTIPVGGHVAVQEVQELIAPGPELLATDP